MVIDVRSGALFFASMDKMPFFFFNAIFFDRAAGKKSVFDPPGRNSHFFIADNFLSFLRNFHLKKKNFRRAAK